jgi:hypothetical protein
MAFRLNCGLLLLGIALPCVGAPEQPAEPPTPNGLADASLEEMMNIEVASMSKKAGFSSAGTGFNVAADEARSVVPRAAEATQTAQFVASISSFLPRKSEHGRHLLLEFSNL